MIDLVAIRRKFALIAQEKVGQYLAQESSVPVVVPARPNVVRHSYPYITVDIIDVTPNTGWVVDIESDVNGDDIYKTTKDLMILFRCYGGETSSANEKLSQYIINELQNVFMFSSVREDLRSTLNIGVITTGNIDSLPIQLSDKYLETAAFEIVIKVCDEAVDANTFVIETVDLDGDVYSLQGESTPSVVIDILKPQP